MRRFLLTLTAFITLLLIAMMVVPRLINWQSYRGDIERRLSDATGLPVRVSGQINLSLLPGPSFLLGSVTAEDKIQGVRFEAQSFTVKLSILDLLKGNIVVEDALLNKPVFTVVTSSDTVAPLLARQPTNFNIQDLPAIIRLRFYDAELRHTSEIAAVRFDGEINLNKQEGVIRGNLVLHEAQDDRKLRFALSSQSSSAFLVRAQLEDEKAVARYSLEGVLDIAATNPSFLGKLDAVGALALQAGQSARSLTWRMVADVKADTQSLKFEDLRLGFGSVKNESVITGNLLFGGADNPRIMLQLVSKKLDLDSVMGIGFPPVIQFPALIAELKSQFNGASSQGLLFPITVDVALDEIVLGADSIRNVKVFLNNDDGGLKPQFLSGDLPGGANIQIKNQVTQVIDSANITPSKVHLRIADLDRFRGWIKGDKSEQTAVTPSVQQSLVLDTDIKIDSQAVFLPKFSLRSGQNNLEGSIQYFYAHGNVVAGANGSVSTKPKITGTVASSMLNLDALLAPPKIGQPTKNYSLPAYTQSALPDISLDIGVELNHMRYNGVDINGVSARLKREDHELQVHNFKIADLGGMMLEGEVSKTITGLSAKLHLSGQDTPRFAQALMPAMPVVIADWWKITSASQSPMDLKIELERPDTQTDIATNIKIDGTLAQTNLAVTGELFPLNSAQPTKLLIALRTEQSVQLLQQFGLVSDALQTDVKFPGQADLSVIGNFAKGVQIKGTSIIADAKSQVDGKLDFTAPAAPFQGMFSLKIPDIAHFGAALSANADLFPSNVRYDFSSRMIASPFKITLTEAKSTLIHNEIAIAKIGGEIAFDLSRQQQIAGQIKADFIDARWLSSYPLGFAATIIKPDESWSADAQMPPELSSVHGDVWLEVDKLKLTDTLTLDDAQFVFKFEPASIGFEGFECRYVGGRITSEAKITRQNNQVQGVARIKLTDLDVDRLSAIPLSARLNGQVDLVSNGKSMAGFMSAMNGNGALSLRNIRLDTVDTRAFEGFAATQGKQGTVGSKDLNEELDQKMRTGFVSAIAGNFMLSIANGVLKTEPLKITTNAIPVQIQSTFAFADRALNFQTRLQNTPVLGNSPLQAIIAWRGTPDYLERNVDVNSSYQDMAVPVTGKSSVKPK